MDRLPLHVLTGFLGSGKTTLLNRMVRDPALADVAVLINEIGAVSIDHHLVDRIEPGDGLDIIVLQGGCTCCTVRSDLVAALRELHGRRAAGAVPPFRRVVLETTGLADPAPVLFTLVGDPILRHKFEAGAVLALVDALNAPAQLSRYAECRKQIAVADRLVVSKTDLAGAGAMAAMAKLVRSLNPGAEIFDAAALDALDALLDCPATAFRGWSTDASSHPVRCRRTTAPVRQQTTRPISDRLRFFSSSRSIGPSLRSGSACCCIHMEPTCCDLRRCSTCADGPARSCSTASITSFIHRSICPLGPKDRASHGSFSSPVGSICGRSNSRFGSSSAARPGRLQRAMP